MTTFRRFLCCLFLLLFAAIAAAQSSSNAEQPTRWYRGSIHAHTLNSDGDATPDEVTRWYRENGYQFLIITDHNYVTNVDALNHLHGADDRFLVVSGEEVSDHLGEKSIHVNALGVRTLINPQGGSSVAETLQRNVDAIRTVGGVPLINHPNFTWAITSADLAQVSNANLFELHSGHPHVNVYGGGGSPSVESMWDEVLSKGKVLFGAAVDDAHDYKTVRPGFGAKPGQAWVVVRATSLTSPEIVRALETGNFYCSTGVELTTYQVSEKSITIAVKEQRGSKYTVRFIGEGGRTLAEVYSNPAVYEFQGTERYVRAKVIESNGKIAWTQPVFPARSRK